MAVQLSEARVLITGGTSGIGRAVAVSLASHGAVVAVSGRNAERGQQVVGEIESTGGKAEFLDGIEIVLVAVGLFAVAEVLHAVLFEGKIVETQNRLTRVHMDKRDWRRSIPAWLRGTAIGAPFGCIDRKSVV